MQATGTSGVRRRPEDRRLTRRLVGVSALLSTVIGAGFFILALAIDALRDSESRANHALEVLVAANRLERLVIDVETAQRGFIITGERSFLQPWRKAQAAYADQATVLERLARAGNPGQDARAQEITRAGDSYIRTYSEPLVAMAQRDLDSARTVAVTEEGERRVDALRGKFERFVAVESQIFEAGQDRADALAGRALVAASVSVGGSIILILLSGVYLARSVVQPVRRASAMADLVAGGDLSVRMPEAGPGEVGVLERAFNVMTNSLETSRDELRRIADGQAALSRVATLVARGVSPPEVFGAVAAETGRLLGAEGTAVARFEPDGSAAVAGFWDQPGDPGLGLSVGARWPAEAESVMAEVRQTGEPARVPSYAAAGGAAAAWATAHGIRSSMASPIIVEGQLWGAVIALSGEPGPHPEDTEERLRAFTELVAMAVANTESRAQLAASRARVVAAADETRRRIERDLHDGAQHRLITLALELRAAEAQVPPEQQSLTSQWSRTAQGLAEVVEELREISRGLHPAILEKGGLGPALRALARRAAVPVELSVGVTGRLQERVEAAAYYVVSEALTNVAKHARASVVQVDIGVDGGTLRLTVTDDGAGGADPSRGSGLIGLSDRVAAVGGTFEVISPPGGGTSLRVTIPVAPVAAGPAPG
jgi:signal transduction histidine kinase